jgi:hypothetical protein
MMSPEELRVHRVALVALVMALAGWVVAHAVL